MARVEIYTCLGWREAGCEFPCVHVLSFIDRSDGQTALAILDRLRKLRDLCEKKDNNVPGFGIRGLDSGGGTTINEGELMGSISLLDNDDWNEAVDEPDVWDDDMCEEAMPENETNRRGRKRKKISGKKKKKEKEPVRMVRKVIRRIKSK